MAKRGVLLVLVFVVATLETVTAENANYDPCCSFPCQNFGICNRVGFTDKYYCDCAGTSHYGHDCETPTWGKWLFELIRPSPFTVQYLTTNGEYIWKIINKIQFLHDIVMRAALKIRAMGPAWPEPHNTMADYVTWDGYANKSYWGLTLPAVPKNCPTPLGIAGPKELPDVKKLVADIFTRTEFKPCPRGTTAILPTYGQHFTHQGFKTNRAERKLTWGSQSVDLSHLYGETLEKQLSLRTMKGGKMKMQVINGEEYPPYEKDCPNVYMYPSPYGKSDHSFALGHPFFAMLPSLLYWSTLWLREHNRVCDIMAKEHPDWDDERLFQTTRLIILGETMKVTVESYVQHVSGMHVQLTFEPELLHGQGQRWSSSRIHVEFNSLYHWHNLIPDNFLIAGQNYSLFQTFYKMNSLVDHGMKAFTESMSNQVAGRGAGGRNLAKPLHDVFVKTILWNREVRLQSFNRYRKFLRLPPVKTFEELTGETKLAKILSDFYDGDIDGVEFFVGLMVEKRFKAKMFGLTLIEAISSYSLRSVFSNTIGSPEFWRESTFGGKVGFDRIKSYSLEQLVCENIEGCPEIKFQIPEAVTEDSDAGMIYGDLEDLLEKVEEKAKGKPSKDEL